MITLSLVVAAHATECGRIVRWSREAPQTDPVDHVIAQVRSPDNDVRLDDATVQCVADSGVGTALVAALEAEAFLRTRVAATSARPAHTVVVTLRAGEDPCVRVPQALMATVRPLVTAATAERRDPVSDLVLFPVEGWLAECDPGALRKAFADGRWLAAVQESDAAALRARMRDDALQGRVDAAIAVLGRDPFAELTQVPDDVRERFLVAHHARALVALRGEDWLAWAYRDLPSQFLATGTLVVEEAPAPKRFALRLAGRRRSPGFWSGVTAAGLGIVTVVASHVMWETEALPRREDYAVLQGTELIGWCVAGGGLGLAGLSLTLPPIHF